MLHRLRGHTARSNATDFKLRQWLFTGESEQDAAGNVHVRRGSLIHAHGALFFLAAISALAKAAYMALAISTMLFEPVVVAATTSFKFTAILPRASVVCRPRLVGQHWR